MKLITELIRFAWQRNMLTEEHKRKLQADGFYTFYYDRTPAYTWADEYEYDDYRDDFEDSREEEIDRKYYGDFYHPGNHNGRGRHEKRPPVGPKLTVEELNQRVEEDWKRLTEEFPNLEPLWDSWKAGKLERVLADGFTLNDVYDLMNVEPRDFQEFSGPAPTAYRQLLHQVGNIVGKYSWVIKSAEMACTVEFLRFRQQILEEVRTLYETDRERFGVLSSQNGKLDFPSWEKAVQTNTTSMKVWTILNLSSMPVTVERIEAILTWKLELAIAMQMNLDYLTELVTKLTQRDWSSLVVITEHGIDNTILKSVIIPEGASTIGSRAFSCCRSLTSVVITEGVKTIGEEAFRGCSSLTSAAIPKGVTEIRNGAFRGCSSLTSVVIPEGVTTIGRDAFCECSYLTTVTISKGVREIVSGTFASCSSLKSVTIPEGVFWIGCWAFEDCPNLTIHAPARSYAEKYAKENKIPFQPLEEEK